MSEPLVEVPDEVCFNRTELSVPHATRACRVGRLSWSVRQGRVVRRGADMVISGDDDDVATPGVAAALTVLAGIAASDAAKLKMRVRGRDHREAVPMLATVRPHGQQMSQDLERLLNRKDDAHYGLHLIGRGDAERMLGWAKRIVGNARKVLESG